MKIPMAIHHASEGMLYIICQHQKIKKRISHTLVCSIADHLEVIILAGKVALDH
jgi:hypothetical protein